MMTSPQLSHMTKMNDLSFFYKPYNNQTRQGGRPAWIDVSQQVTMTWHLHMVSISTFSTSIRAIANKRTWMVNLDTLTLIMRPTPLGQMEMFYGYIYNFITREQPNMAVLQTNMHLNQPACVDKVTIMESWRRWDLLLITC